MIHGPTGRRLSYGALVDKAAALPLPRNVPLKDPKDFKLIGTPAKRLDAPDKVNGTAQFGIDVKVPGMKVATVAACPVFGGKLASVDDSKAKAIKGVLQVVRLDDAVAVVADHMWAAKQGLSCARHPLGRGAEREAPHRRYRAATGGGVTAVGRGRAPGGQSAQGHGERRPEGRGGLRGAVPRARHHGAGELHRPRSPGRLRYLGGNTGADFRSDRGRAS